MLSCRRFDPEEWSNLMAKSTFTLFLLFTRCGVLGFVLISEMSTIDLYLRCDSFIYREQICRFRRFETIKKLPWKLRVTSCQPAENVGERIVICGAGIAGSWLAYHLSLRGSRPTIIDSRDPHAASICDGSGNLVAGTWLARSKLSSLATIGSELNSKIASELPDCGYQRMPFLRIATWPWEQDALNRQRAISQSSPSLDASRKTFLSADEVRQHFPWLDAEDVLGGTVVNDAASCAHVQANELIPALLRAAERRGARFVRGTVDGFYASDDGTSRCITGLSVGGSTIEADCVAVALGAWSALASDWLGIPLPISGVKWHSILLRLKGQELATNQSDANTRGTTVGEKSAFAPCFVQAPLPFSNDERPGLCPYIVPCDDELVWVGGSCDGDASALGATLEAPDAVTVDDAVCQLLFAGAGAVSSGLGAAEVVQRRADVRAVTPDNCPIIGGVRGMRGAYVLTGFSAWTALLAPAAAAALADLMLGGNGTMDLADFSPNRFSDPPPPPPQLDRPGSPEEAIRRNRGALTNLPQQPFMPDDLMRPPPGGKYELAVDGDGNTYFRRVFPSRPPGEKGPAGAAAATDSLATPRPPPEEPRIVPPPS